MSPFSTYNRIGQIEARPYVLNEPLDRILVPRNVNPAKDRGFIARDMETGRMWYIEKEYFNRMHSPGVPYSEI